MRNVWVQRERGKDERELRRRVVNATGGMDPYSAVARGESPPVVLSQACVTRMVETIEHLTGQELGQSQAHA